MECRSLSAVNVSLPLSVIMSTTECGQLYLYIDFSYDCVLFAHDIVIPYLYLRIIVIVVIIVYRFLSSPNLNIFT